MGDINASNYGYDDDDYDQNNDYPNSYGQTGLRRRQGYGDDDDDEDEIYGSPDGKKKPNSGATPGGINPTQIEVELDSSGEEHSNLLKG